VRDLAQAPKRGGVTRVHLVAPGETLEKIADRYQKEARDILNANKDLLSGNNQVNEGTALIIP